MVQNVAERWEKASFWSIAWLKIYSPATLFRLPFAFNCLNSSRHRFNKKLETLSFMITWHIVADFSAVHHWFYFPVPPHPKGPLSDCNLVTMEAIWLLSIHCHGQETSLRWFDLFDMAYYPTGNSNQKMDTLYIVVIKVGWSVLLSLPPAGHSRWLPLPKPGSPRGFFLLKLSFSVPLLPTDCSFCLVIEVSSVLL